MFGKTEEINGDGLCPTYLWRWTVMKWKGGGIYIHYFVGDDWALDLHLHDNSKRFINIGIRGSLRAHTAARAEGTEADNERNP
jgi:hypothetical protein